jgi:hypothetical protein
MNNDVLQLKGTFEQRRNTASFGKPSIPLSETVGIEKIDSLSGQLSDVLDYWKRNQELFTGALIEVHYTNIVAKSNRIKKIFSRDSKRLDNNSIVGARFTDNGKRHIITHFVSLDDIEEAIKKIDLAKSIMGSNFGGHISGGDIDSIDDKDIDFGNLGIVKTLFLQIIVDAYRIEKFGIPDNAPDIDDDAQRIVSIFDIGRDIGDVLLDIGIVSLPRKVDKLTALLTPDDIEILKQKAPSLVAMSLVDLCSLTKDSIVADVAKGGFPIPEPSNEPIIGVIDTRFDSRVHFSDWVEYHDMIDKNLPDEQDDYWHGTAVSSIIVDGAKINPDLDDGCGRFKVRHFAVGKHDAIYISTLISSIKEIVASNKDIRVWNLSLGSALEAEKNFISPVAALLDDIQFRYNVIFVIAGTNKKSGDPEHMRIGSPADSINGVVVNAVRRDNKAASYTREGVVLSFFNKPDVSYYGGDEKNDRIRVCTGTGEYQVAGTSFAAPWIARKLAYLIHILGMTRETAKALLIDSATRWDNTYSQLNVAPTIGFGVVPQYILDVVQSKKDEIKFVMSGSSEEYDTYSYNIPVPIVNNEYPYIAKATLCYFPQCMRSQGVDYTNTEMDLYFGRVHTVQIRDRDGGTKERIKIETVNENHQSINYKEMPVQYINEKTARQLYRKWDNTKHIQQYMKKGVRAKKAYDTQAWGVSIKTKERLDKKYGKGLKFGVVITLKEINGLNRIEEFIRQCSLRGWIVSRVNIDNKVDVYNKLQEELNIES